MIRSAHSFCIPSSILNSGGGTDSRLGVTGGGVAGFVGRLNDFCCPPNAPTDRLDLSPNSFPPPRLNAAGGVGGDVAPGVDGFESGGDAKKLAAGFEFVAGGVPKKLEGVAAGAGFGAAGVPKRPEDSGGTFVVAALLRLNAGRLKGGAEDESPPGAGVPVV